MPSYDLPIDDIRELGFLLRDLPDTGPEEWGGEEPEWLASMARERQEAFVRAYLRAFACFLKLLRAIMDRRIGFLNDAAGGARRYAYLAELVPVYDDAVARADRLLAVLFEELMADSPESTADILAVMLASGTPREMVAYATTVPAAESGDEADEQGEAGKQIADSVKRLIKAMLFRMKPFRRKKKRQEWVEHTLHAINEVLGVVFRVPA